MPDIAHISKLWTASSEPEVNKRTRNAASRRTCFREAGSYLPAIMKLTTIQDLAIQARMAGVVGADAFDRLFAGIHFDEMYDTMLYAFVEDEEKAAEIEDQFSLHIAAIALMVLKMHVEIVLVMPKVLQ